MRLRIVDFNTPWFWLVMFFNGHAYGKPTIECLIYKPNRWKRWWAYVWKWENIPIEQGAYATDRRSDI